MPRNREYKPWLRSNIRADHLGYPYPPMPAEGPRQVLGSMSVDENITPVVPEWLPKRFWTRWSEIWHGRVKQYKSPYSKELLPWDTTHSVLGDYNGYEEYYVEGCFGYDKCGKEIMYRPGLPQVHRWHGQGLHIVELVWTAPELPPPEPTMFNFYTSASSLEQNEVDDIKLKKPGSITASHLDIEHGSNEDTKFSEDDFTMVIAADIFQDPLTEDNPVSNTETAYPVLEDDGQSKPHLNLHLVKESVSTIDANISSKDTSLAKHNEAGHNLMSLPGEIRNVIYRYLFDESNEYEIVWCTTQKDLTHYIHKVPIATKGFKTGWRHKSRDNDSLDAFFERPVLNRKWTTTRRRYARLIYGKNNHEDRVEELQAAGPAAFLLTCRRAYNETVCIFYGQHTFSFCSRGLLRNFMGKLSQRALASINRLYIAHDPQAWPVKTTDAVLVNKEYEYWVKDLKDMVTGCTSLQELTMLVQIRDPHVNNADRAGWAMALRRGLAGLKYLDKFQYFDLTIRLADDSSNVVWAAAHGTVLQVDRARDLQDLVWLVKSNIFEPIQEDEKA